MYPTPVTVGHNAPITADATGAPRQSTTAGVPNASITAILARLLAGHDAVLVATHHAAYAWRRVADHAKRVVDTRNALRT